MVAGFINGAPFQPILRVIAGLVQAIYLRAKQMASGVKPAGDAHSEMEETETKPRRRR
jgi:hypothetical protein